MYRINGSQVALAKYLEALEKIGIVTKARNCLVFQVKTVLKVSVDRHEIMLQTLKCSNTLKRDFRTGCRRAKHIYVMKLLWCPYVGSDFKNCPAAHR